ncbi:MAG: hypothetical protein IPP48_02655 [Chitinophagaceae bacterium]|nr:hypothetical protein [Chitinophagaceae bacterium]
MGTPDQIVDPKIRGAVNSQRELGLEMKFAKNRVGFSVTYWDGTSKDFLIAVQLQVHQALQADC